MDIKRKFYYFLPPSFRFLMRRIYFFPADLWKLITGDQDSLTPPKGLIFIGAGDFKKIGLHYLKLFEENCNLKSNHRVLDIGCGIGRIAIPLTKFLDTNGSYEGFDIVKTGIDWCNKHISTVYPNFRFFHVDLKNDLYNLKTERSAKSFEFPYPDSDFDMVVLTSVFTHMLPEDIENYTKEIHRILKPGGKCLVTFFILNKESRSFMKSNSGIKFEHNLGYYSLIDKNVKEANVAYEEDYLMNLFKQNNLKIEKVIYGFWSGRQFKEVYDYQDTLILTKK